MAVNYVNGAALPAPLQEEVKRRYVHRFTCTHVPAWVRNIPAPDGHPYEPHFRDDSDWLANTDFPVTRSGRLANRPSACISRPTWPWRDQTPQ
jgi:hypothetical protein